MTIAEVVEALVSLSLPETTRVHVAALQPTDVIVVEYDGSLSQESTQRLTQAFAVIWPGQKVVVLDHGLTMKIIRETEAS